MFGFIKGAIAEFDFNVFGSLEESLVNLDAMGDLIQDIVSGKITDKELLAIGINEAVGDLHYVIKNFHIVSSKKTYSNATVYKFGKHLAGAYGEMVRAVATVVGAVKSVKALKAKIKGAIKAKNTKPSNAKGARNAGKGFETFNDLKKYLGSPGEGNQWHHIVEQSQIKKSGFSASQIQNTNNIIAIDNATHAKISGYYSSKQAFTGGKTVRDWLAGQSYGEQYNFGIDILKVYGVII